MLKIILGVVIATLIGVVAFAFVPKIANANQTPTQIVEDANKLTISITGEVVKPGNYILEEGSTLQDLLDKAGGANNNADSKPACRISDSENIQCTTSLCRLP